MNVNHQEVLVMNYMRAHGSITQKQAWDVLGVSRLSAVIHTLRHKRGFIILDEMDSGKNRFGVMTHFKRYYLP